MAVTLSPGLSAGFSAPRLIEPAAGNAVRIAAPVFARPPSSPLPFHFLSRTRTHKKHGSNAHNVSLGIPDSAAALTLPPPQAARKCCFVIDGVNRCRPWSTSSRLSRRRTTRLKTQLLELPGDESAAEPSIPTSNRTDGIE